MFPGDRDQDDDRVVHTFPQEGLVLEPEMLRTRSYPCISELKVLERHSDKVLLDRVLLDKLEHAVLTAGYDGDVEYVNVDLIDSNVLVSFENYAAQDTVQVRSESQPVLQKTSDLLCAQENRPLFGKKDSTCKEYLCTVRHMRAAIYPVGTLLLMGTI